MEARPLGGSLTATEIGELLDQLPPGVDPKSIQAATSNGVLKISIPKPARWETQKIEVKEGGGDGQAKEAA